MSDNITKNTIKMPNHIGFIMDGNGRWAQAKGLPRQRGHVKGVEVAEKVIDFVCEHKIRCATFYTFSTENWSRPKIEIDTILSLLSAYIDIFPFSYFTRAGLLFNDDGATATASRAFDSN